jgi:hypothetical protein
LAGNRLGSNIRRIRRRLKASIETGGFGAILWGGRGATRCSPCKPVKFSGYIVGVGHFREAFAPVRKRDTFLLALRRDLPFVLMLALAFGVAEPVVVRAQGKLEARYSMTLAGIPIGKGSWTVDITDTHYAAVASGGTSGLLRAFSSGQGNSSVQGTLQAGQPVSSIYASVIATSKKSDEVHLTVTNGTVKESRLEPPLDSDPDRVPITDEHRKGILDPMTASLLRTPGTGDALSQEACNRTAAVFDGRLRYDLRLAFKRLDRANADKGYAGPVVVCSVYFSPIAGFIPSRAAVRYVSKQRDIEVWLAPIAGTRVLVPYRVQGPTPLGRVVLEATEFVSTALPTGASANGPKTQTGPKTQ